MKRIWMKAILAAVAGFAMQAATAEAAVQKCANGYSCGKSGHASLDVKKSKKYGAKSTSSRKVAHKSSAKSSGGQSGIASWYGGNFHGRQTASGERYNQNALTAAHRSLPFGTRVRVTNTSTGSSVVVRINDRGPFVGGRVIDLSRAAASTIGINGLGHVKLAVLGRG